MPPIDRDAKIPCPTPQHLQIELDALMVVLELREQEDTWEKMERAIIRFTGITRGGGYKHLPLFIEGMGKMGVGLKLGVCMLSDRGRLSGVATELLQTLAPRLSSSFQPLVTVYLPPLIQLLGRPNKVFLKRAEKCLWTIISNCHLPSILTELKRGLSDEAATCRRGCAAGFERALIDWDRSQFGEKGVGVLEEALRKVGGDKDVEVRAIGKRVWASFSEIWPERVDEFSAPLTPTIRRYLGVSASASNTAGPSKPKIAPPRLAPTRPPPSGLSASTSSVHIPPPVAIAPIPSLPIISIPPPPPVMAPPPEPLPSSRSQVLSGRAVRPPLPTSQSEAILPSNPSASRRSPVRSVFPGGPAIPAQNIETSEPIRPRILSSRAPRYPPGVLSQHGRSVSHSVLPLSYPETFSQPPIEAPVTHLQDPPIRPAFPTSFSTTSLPPLTTASEDAATWQPSRRFASSTRSVRPPPMTLDDPSLDAGPSRSTHPPITPHILRGAVRSAQPPIARRDLGAAQRIVSAPLITIPPTPDIIPALRASTSVRDRIMEMERKNAEVEAAGVPLPISPVIERFGSGSRSGTPNSRLRSSSSTPVKLAMGLDSPMMPMLAKSLRGKEAEINGDKGEQLMDEEIPEDVADLTLRSDPGNKRDTIEVIRNEVAGSVEVVVEKPTKAEDNQSPAQPDLITIPSTDTLPPSTTAIKPTVNTISSVPMAAISKASNTSKPPPPSSTALPPSEPKTRKPPLPPIAPRAKPVPPTAAEQLPPVTTNRAAKPRLPGVEVRKPFRPTTKAPLPPTSSASSSSTPKTVTIEPREQVVRVSKPPIPPRTVSSTSTKPSTRASTTVKTTIPQTTTLSSASTATTTRPRVASSNLTKPTAASLHRAAPTHTLPSAKLLKPPILTSTTTLPPPMKKDKIKRKAAVPSFRPTRNTESTFGKGTVSLSASTISSGSDLQARKEMIAKVKIRPETVPLPSSPKDMVRPEEVELPSPIRVSIGEFTGKVKVKIRPKEVGEPREETVSMIATEIPLPPSPTSSSFPLNDMMSTTPPVSPPHRQHAPITISLSSTASPERDLANLNDLGLPVVPTRDATPISKATLPPSSDSAGSDSEDEEEQGNGGDLDRVKFGKIVKARSEIGRDSVSETASTDIPSAVQDAREIERDLIEFSTSSRSVQPVPSTTNIIPKIESEKDLIEFSAPSRSIPSIALVGGNEENDLIRSIDGDLQEFNKGIEIGLKMVGGGSPRIALGERDRNGVLKVDELLL